MNYELKELVVSPDDFKNKFGKDLYAILKDSDNNSDYPFIFLKLVQDFLIDWCDEHGYRRNHYNELNSVQKKAFQEAILYQAYYAWYNGLVALGLDSGYDSERGITVNGADLERLAVPSRVINLLHKCGLFNLNVKNRPRIGKGYPWAGYSDL